MIEKIYADYAWEQTEKFLAIDSPSGYTTKAANWVKNAFEELGCPAWLTTKGGVMKIFNRLGESGVVAAYNITSDNAVVQGSVSPKDAGMGDCDVAYFEYFRTSCIINRHGSV